MVRRRDLPSQRDQFEEAAVELHEAVLGAPGMDVARAHLEAEPAVEGGLRLEIARGQHEMVETAGGRRPHHASSTT